MVRSPHELDELFRSAVSKAKNAAPAVFEASTSAKNDAKNLYDQKGKHRDKLLKLVGRLSIFSFSLLAVAILLQMIVRIFKPDYDGISDVALNILAVSVFGEVIAVVGTIVYQVWKDPK